jgi:nicotinamide mononucleotide transporter
MAVIGYVSWSTTKAREVKIKTWTFQQHLLNIVISGAITLILGFLFSEYTDQAAPYIDSFTTVFSLAATFMVTRKVIGNWMYWIVIDLFSVYLYDSRGYQLLAVQMFIFTILAAFAYVSWRKKLKVQSA